MTTITRHPWTVERTLPVSLPQSGDLVGLVDVKQVKSENEYPLGIMIAEGNQGLNGRVLHVQAPWSEAILDRPDAGPRTLAFAKALGARAHMVDAPGIGRGVPHLPKEVIDGIWRGDLHEAARLQSFVLDGVLSAQGADELYGLGTSQGAIMLGASMATAPKGTHYDGAIFIESPGLKRQGLIPFASRFAIDTVLQSKKMGAYRAETPGVDEDVPGNPAHMRKLAQAILQHPDHYLAYVAAMSRDRLLDDIAKARENNVIDEDSQLVFVTGTDTHVSPVEWNEMAVRRASELGVGGVHLVTLLGENHGMYESTGRMHAVLKKIGKEIFGIVNGAA